MVALFKSSVSQKIFYGDVVCPEYHMGVIYFLELKKLIICANQGDMSPLL
jgi:hypothetical protein